MRSAIKWTLLIVAAVFVGALVEPFFIARLTDIGWYSDPTQSVGKAVNFISRLIGEGAFPWVAGIVFGLTFGVWLDWLLRRRDATLTERCKAVGLEIANVLTEFRRAKGGLDDPSPDQPAPTMERLETLAPRSLAVMVSMSKLGMKVPYWHPDSDPVGYLKHSINFYERIEPLARAGHLKEARYVAKVLTGVAARNASNADELRPFRWLRELVARMRQ